VLYNITTACNRSTADFIVSSPLLSSDYDRALPDPASVIRR
jgi:methylglyoxal synthase